MGGSNWVINLLVGEVLGGIELIVSDLVLGLAFELSDLALVWSELGVELGYLPLVLLYHAF